MNNNKPLPIAIIGAGPIGLAAAAHLTIRGIPYLLFEAGNTAGTNILSWQHVRVFSPWKYNLDKAAATLLKSSNWIEPDPSALPTGKELYENYLKPFSDFPKIKPFIHLNSKVRSIGRQNFDKMKTLHRTEQPFILQVEQAGKGIKFYEARAILDASGTWANPNPMGSGGTFAYGEVENSSRIFYGIPDISGKDKERYKNKTVAVVGGGHSAINTLLELDRLKDEFPKTQIKWILRKSSLADVYGGKEKDALEARGALGIKIEQMANEERVDVYSPFHIEELHLIDERLTIVGRKNGERRALPGIDEVISNTGSRPDFSFLREIRLDIDPGIESVTAIADLIDPNVHSCGTVRTHGERELRHHEKDFYIIGSKSYGRAPTFLMATGYEQVRSIAAALAGDFESAAKVELDLPQTGVCSSDKNPACCGTSQKTPITVTCCG